MDGNDVFCGKSIITRLPLTEISTAFVVYMSLFYLMDLYYPQSHEVALRIMREKPNANHIVLAAIIMTQTNNMSEWRYNLGLEKRSCLMRWAQKSTQKQYEDFNNCRIDIRKKQNEKRLDKLEGKKRAALKVRLLKETTF